MISTVCIPPSHQVSSFSFWFGPSLTSHSGTVWEKIGVPMSKLFKFLFFGGAIIVVWYLRRYCSWKNSTKPLWICPKIPTLPMCSWNFGAKELSKSHQGEVDTPFPPYPNRPRLYPIFSWGVGVEPSPPVDFCSSNPRISLGPSDQLP